MLQESLKSLLHIFYPHVCKGCGSDVINSTNLLCLKCIAALPKTNFENKPGNPVEQKFYGRMPVCNATASYFFTKNSILLNLIYQLKYRGNKDIGLLLGEMLGEQLSASMRFEAVDAIVPLPLNKQREKQRGYNQAAVIARGINRVWNKPVVDNAVIRKVNTQTQTKRDRISRWENMKEVFSVENSDIVKHKHLLLVDDVITTGASLEACGLEILKTDGVTLSIATLAFTS